MKEKKVFIKSYNCYFSRPRFQDPENLLEVKQCRAKLNSNESSNQKIFSDLSEARENLENFKHFVYSNFKGENDNLKNIDYIQAVLFEIKNKMNFIKNEIQQKLFNLVNIEETTVKELQFLRQKILEWPKLPKFKTLKNKTIIIKLNNGNSPTSEFQEFLLKFGGHCGGWSEHEHFLFVKNRKKFNSKKLFFSSLLSLLPSFTYDDIVAHENWYIKYLSLKNSQKEAIAKWKVGKKCFTEEKKSVEVEPKKENKLNKHYKNISEKIAKWRQQELLKKEANEKYFKEEELKLKAEEKKRKEIYKKKKLLVAKYKAEKLIKFQEEELKNEKKINCKEKSNILLKSLRLRDMKYAEKKKFLILQVKHKNKCMAGQKKSEFFALRNPERVFQPTLIWSKHCEKNQQDKAPNPLLHLSLIPRLAVPEWRKGLTF